MAQKHPDNAVYVAKDAKSGAEVSFDQWGRKLDSNGNVVHGDYQSAGDAGAQYYERPQQKQEAPPQQQQPQQQSPSQWTTGPGGPMSTVAAQRSAWDNSIVAPLVNGSPVTARRGNNPNVLAPGGIDTTTGQAYPTASNGGWRAPTRSWGGFPADNANNFNTSMTGGQAGSAWDMPARQSTSAIAPPDMPMAEQLRSYVPTPTDEAMAGAARDQMRSYVPPSQSTPSLLPNPPRYDGYDSIYVPQLYTPPGQQPQGATLRIPNVYQPETYTRPNDLVFNPPWVIP